MRTLYCAACACEQPSKVTDSRDGQWGDAKVVRRRRECGVCGKRSTTIEIDIDVLDRLMQVDEPTEEMAQRVVELIVERLAGAGKE